MNKAVLVLGAGQSGIHASDLLIAMGRSVILYDGNESLVPEEIAKKLTGPAKIVLGDLGDDVLESAEYAVISPGIPMDIPPVRKIRSAGLKVLSEIELAWLYERGTVIGITGTNGKTTTVTLVGDIMKAAFGPDKAFTVGNIGTPYTEKVTETTKDSVTTVELSSFQLETVDTFHPHVSAILNITPDHLNRHHTMEAYAEAKERVAENQDASDFIVLNAEDERLRVFGETLKGPRVLWFSGTVIISRTTRYIMRKTASASFLWGRTKSISSGAATMKTSSRPLPSRTRCRYRGK